ncbi:MAG: putative quinol monooxygenase [Arenibacterium sp.]
MLIVSGIVEVAAEGVEALKAAAIEMAQETRKEDGCITYGFWQDLEDPNRFRVYEEWRDLAALEAHFTAPHMGVFRAAVGQAGLVSRDIVRFERGEATPI